MGSVVASGPCDAAEPVLTLPRWLVRGGAAAIVLAYLVLLGAFPLSDPDETRYAEIPREMIESGDWVTPRLNYVKYFEKPPLVYWLTALNFTVFGMSDLVARWWVAFFGLAGIAVTYGLARSIYGPTTGYMAAALLAASPFYFGLSQFLTLDMPLSACIGAGLASFWWAYVRQRRRSGYVPLLYVMVGLAVLIKGPVAVVLSAATIVCYLITRNDLGALRWLWSPAGMCLFAAVVLPWFVVVSLRNPEFVHFFVVDQHFDRYLQPEEHREPLWYYVPILVGGMLPWSAFVLLAPRHAVRFVRQLVARHVAPGTLFLAVWSVVIFAFFTASGSKVGTYVLPMCSPLAILAARFFEQVLSRREDAVMRRGYVFTLVLATVTLIWGLVTPWVVDDPRLTLVASRTWICGGVLMLAATLSMIFAGRGARLAAASTLWIGVLLMQLVAVSGRAVASSYEILGEAIRVQSAPADLIVGYRRYTQGTTFYGRRRTVQVLGHGELEFGRKLGDQRAFFWSNDEELLRVWASPQRVFLIIDRRELEPLRPQLQPPPRVIAAEGRKVIVVNFAGNDAS